MPGIDQVAVIEAAPKDPFSMPVRAMDTLLQFTPGESAGHRVRVQGVVMLQKGEGSIFITDETSGLSIQTRQGTPVEPGDRIDVIGFAVNGEYAPILQNAAFQKVGSGSPPTPVPPPMCTVTTTS